MKKVFLILLLLSFVSSAKAADTFLKLGAGLVFEQDFNMPSGVSRSVVGTSFAPSIAYGFNYPDSFSLFLSGEWMPGSSRYEASGDGGLLLNLQYTLRDITWIKPYVYSGLGLDLSPYQFPLGLAFQLAVGSYIPIDTNFDLYLESKIYVSGGVSSSNGSGFWNDTVFPNILGGVQFKL